MGWRSSLPWPLLLTAEDHRLGEASGRGSEQGAPRASSSSPGGGVGGAPGWVEFWGQSNLCWCGGALGGGFVPGAGRQGDAEILYSTSPPPAPKPQTNHPVTLLPKPKRKAATASPPTAKVSAAGVLLGVGLFLERR